MGFHVVRSTKPCVLISSQFIPPREFCCPRDPSHVAKNPEYPHPSLYLTQAQKYMFRHQKLRHLRIEQLVRYFSSSSGASKSEQETNEDTTAPDDEAIGVDVHHRSPNFNSFF